MPAKLPRLLSLIGACLLALSAHVQADAPDPALASVFSQAGSSLGGEGILDLEGEMMHTFDAALVRRAAKVAGISRPLAERSRRMRSRPSRT